MDSREIQEEYAAYIGIDWSHSEHAFALYAEGGEIEKGKVSQAPEELHAWLEQLQERFEGRLVAIAVETPKGPLINALKEYPWVRLFPINPFSSSRYREAFSPSGAKSDGPDAKMLLEMVRFHRDRLREMLCQDSLTEEIGQLCEARRSAVDDRTRLTNRLREVLKGYYPQSIVLVGEQLHTKLALDFLSAWPDPLSLKEADLETVRKFYYAHNIRRKQTIKERLDLIENLKFLTTDYSIIKVSVMQVRELVAGLRPLQKTIAEYDAAIEAAVREHPEYKFYRNLPGAGPVLAPRLLAALGTVRTLYPDAESLQKASGIAPVTKQSGNTKSVHWRWNAPHFLHQTFVEWARQTTKYSVWAKAYAQAQKAKGKNPATIHRALAFKWIRILWRCWQDGTPYDEVRYLKQLARRGSPYAPKEFTDSNIHYGLGR